MGPQGKAHPAQIPLRKAGDPVATGDRKRLSPAKRGRAEGPRLRGLWEERPAGPTAEARTRGRRFPPGTAVLGRGLGRGPHALARTLPGSVRRAAPAARPVEAWGRDGGVRRTCPAPLRRADGRLHPPGASLTSRRDPARSSAPARGRGRDPGRPRWAAAAAAGSVVRPAAANLLRSLSRLLGSPPAPPQPHNNMAAAASAGSRGAGRRATGGQ
ncbi:fibroblast growth factor 2-like [Apodemus sylvaticus]|uniref:fibroblast growth factor 2-like n=1 Tax=Apodemus sylvaticus TaxID=10129 RepID=UPI0022438C33|nr:fibroblast growth factor 2-like [Apodemus sylvaticus]